MNSVFVYMCDGRPERFRRKAYRNRELFLLWQLLIIVVSALKTTWIYTRTDHAVLVDRRENQLAIIKANLVRRECAGWKARLPRRKSHKLHQNGQQKEHLALALYWH